MRRDFPLSTLSLRPLYFSSFKVAPHEEIFGGKDVVVIRHSGENRNPGWAERGCLALQGLPVRKPGMDTGFRRYDRNEAAFQVWLRLCRAASLR